MLLALGLQFNAQAVLWTSYYLSAKDFYAARCENPTSICCQGKCQIAKAEKKQDKAEGFQGMENVRFQPLQPFVASAAEAQEFTEHSVPFYDMYLLTTLIGFSSVPTQPPRA